MKRLLVGLLAGASLVFGWAQTTNTNKPGAGGKSQSNLESSGGAPTNVQAAKDKSVPFDVDVGFDTTWAAEKKLISLFKAEGFIMRGQPYKDGVENSVFARASDGVKVNYAYARPKVYGEPAHYILSVSPNSPGLTILLSVAGKISPDRLTLINEAFREFKETSKPVVKQSGDLQHRGDFRVKADQNTLELDNLWKAKGI